MAEGLPFHPYLTHPHTGCRLRAVGLVAGRLVWPMLGASEGDDSTGAGQDDKGTEGKQQGSDYYPANTPWQDMTPGQQVNYWKAQARRHEDRAKAAPSQEELAELREKAKRQDDLEHELSTEAEKRERAAREATQAEADAKYRPKLAETAFKIAIGDRKTAEEVREFIDDLNLSRFLTDDGDVDTAKVLARVEQFAPAKGTQQEQRKGPTVTGHGSGSGAGNGSKSSLATLSGSELYDRLHPKPAA